MSTRFVTTVAANDVRSNVWRAALVRNDGNIARASAEFGFTKQRGHALTKRHGLSEEAKAMRLASGQKATGRPRHDPIRVEASFSDPKKGQ